ncbi:MAG: hypothetical protein ACR2H3_05445 [Acidimicrobiales bacterium]
MSPSGSNRISLFFVAGDATEAELDRVIEEAVARIIASRPSRLSVEGDAPDELAPGRSAS